MKKFTKILLIGCLLVMVSCNNWLDVDPKSQVKDKDLFASEMGFKDALSGVYSLMTKEGLYGKELTFGWLGVLGQEWTSVPYNYEDDQKYDFENAASEVRIDSVWTGLYNAIANANKLLKELEGKENLFSGDNYSIIKGEVLALRAYLHFDLLRIFGASCAVGMERIAIPYVTEYAPTIFPQEKVGDFVGKVLKDLQDAAKCLENDPILTGRTVSEIDDNGYLMNRQVHLNYYAVKGLMARVYLYKGDYANAEVCAKEVIGSGCFEWVKQENLTNESVADLTFSTEHLFALNIVTLGNIVDKYLDGGNNSFALEESRLSEYYGSSYDYRYLYLFKTGVGMSNTLRYLKKYDQLESVSWAQSYRNKLPLICLPEMYYILAECRYHSSGDVLEPLNEVCRHRGVADLSEADLSAFETLLLAEYRKEVIGGGQLFFQYKRLNRSVVPGTDVDLAGEGRYVIPMPKEELENPGWVSNQ